MAIVTLQLPEVKPHVAQRPRCCPHCRSSLLQGWGWVTKSVHDPHLQQVQVRRCRGSDCRRPFAIIQKA